MDDNSNPQGTGTAPTQLTDDGFDNFLEDESTRDQTQQPDESEESPNDESQDGEEQGEPEKFVTLADGTQMSAQEFEEQWMPKSVLTNARQKDLVVVKEAEAKLAQLTKQTSLIDAQYKQLEQSNAVTEDYLTSQIPAEPDLRLLASDPAGYMQQKAYYDHHIANLQRFSQIRYQQRQQFEQQQQETIQEMVELENQKLEQAFPHIAGNPEKAKAFHESNVKQMQKYGIDPNRYEQATSAEKRLLARLSYLEAKESARTVKPVASQQRPGVQLQGKSAVNPKQAKTIQAFRQSGNADSAKQALDSGAFDHLF